MTERTRTREKRTRRSGPLYFHDQSILLEFWYIYLFVHFLDPKTVYLKALLWKINLSKHTCRKCWILLKNWYHPIVHQRQFSFTMKLRYISSKRSWEENLIKWRDSSHFQHLRSWRHFYDMADEAAAGCCSKWFRLWNSK